MYMEGQCIHSEPAASLGSRQCMSGDGNSIFASFRYRCRKVRYIAALRANCTVKELCGSRTRTHNPESRTLTGRVDLTARSNHRQRMCDKHPARKRVWAALLQIPHIAFSN